MVWMENILLLGVSFQIFNLNRFLGFGKSEEEKQTNFHNYRVPDP